MPRLKSVVKNCLFCGKEFYTTESETKRGYGKFCSRSCSGKYETGDRNPNWRGGISRNHYHYKCIQKKRYPKRVKARDQVQSAIKKGLLQRKPCIVCGSKEAHAHHDDYTKPLDVVWMCRACHTEAHKHSVYQTSLF